MNKTIGEQIKNERIRRNLTIYRVAKDCELTHDTVTAIERGDNVTLKKVLTIINHLGAEDIVIKWNGESK